MGRQPKVTREEFLEAYYEHKDKGILWIAVKLDITKATAYNYLNQYDLVMPHHRENSMSGLATEILSHFRGQITISDLAHRYMLTRMSVRRYIDRGVVLWYQSESPPRFPRPKKLSQIKIVKVLVEADECYDHNLWDEPNRIAEDTGLKETVVLDYLQYAFNQMWENTNSIKPRTSPVPKLEPIKEKVQPPLIPVEQLRRMCGMDKYKVFPKDELTQEERDRAMAKMTLRGKETLTPVDQLRELMSEHYENKKTNFQKQ